MFTDKSLMSVLLTNGFWYNFLCHRKMGIFELSQNLRQFKLSLIVEGEKKGIKIFILPFVPSKKKEYGSTLTLV